MHNRRTHYCDIPCCVRYPLMNIAFITQSKSETWSLWRWWWMWGRRLGRREIKSSRHGHVFYYIRYGRNQYWNINNIQQSLQIPTPPICTIYDQNIEVEKAWLCTDMKSSNRQTCVQSSVHPRVLSGTIHQNTILLSTISLWTLILKEFWFTQISFFCRC